VKTVKKLSQEGLCIKRLSLVLSLPQNLCDYLSSEGLVFLDLLDIKRAVFCGSVCNAELGVVSNLRKLPFLVTFKVIEKGLLFQNFERLEFNQLAEEILFRMSERII
jgi:hypothetical protein